MMDEILINKSSIENISKAICLFYGENSLSMEQIKSYLRQIVSNYNNYNEDIKLLTEGTIESLVIPNGVTSIGDYAFYGCKNLMNISIPDSVVSVGESAFQGCSKLSMPAMPNGLVTIGDYAFYYNIGARGTINFYDNLVSIGEWAFGYCRNIERLIFPKSLKNIGNRAFSYCVTNTLNPSTGTVEYNGLSYVEFKGKPDNIDNNAFSYCTNLTTINVPWAEGEVAGAPWGATNATINYNYTGE